MKQTPRMQIVHDCGNILGIFRVPRGFIDYHGKQQEANPESDEPFIITVECSKCNKVIGLTLPEMLNNENHEDEIEDGLFRVDWPDDTQYIF